MMRTESDETRVVSTPEPSGAGAKSDRIALAYQHVAAALQAARDADDGAEVFRPGVIKSLQILRDDAGPEFSDLVSRLQFGQRSEVFRLIRQLDAAQAAPAPPASNWPGVGDIGHFLDAAPPSVPWFIYQRLQLGRAALLVGAGGTSKTRFLTQAGMAGVVGRLPWAWDVTARGSVALFLLEDTAASVHRMLSAMADGLGLSAEERTLLATRLRVFPLAGQPSRILGLAPGGALLETNLVQALTDAVAALPPPVVLIGLDPAIALTEGNELDPAHQRRLGEVADRIAIDTGACVLMTAHAAKSLQGADEVGSHAARGSGALTDAVRAEFVLRTMTAAEARQFGIDSIEERKSLVQVVATKGNDLPPAAFAPLWLRRGAAGVLAQAELERDDGTPHVGLREMRALDQLRQLCATGAPRLKDWREACAAAGVVRAGSERAVEKSMDRIRDALLQAGLIERGIGRGVFVPVDVE